MAQEGRGIGLLNKLAPTSSRSRASTRSRPTSSSGSPPTRGLRYRFPDYPDLGLTADPPDDQQSAEDRGSGPTTSTMIERWRYRSRRTTDSELPSTSSLGKLRRLLGEGWSPHQLGPDRRRRTWTATSNRWTSVSPTSKAPRDDELPRRRPGASMTIPMLATERESSEADRGMDQFLGGIEQFDMADQRGPSHPRDRRQLERAGSCDAAPMISTSQRHRSGLVRRYAVSWRGKTTAQRQGVGVVVARFNGASRRSCSSGAAEGRRSRSP